MILAQNLLQCCSRSLLMCFYAFWSPKTWTLCEKHLFSIYKKLKIGPRVPKIGPRRPKTRVLKTANRRPNQEGRGPIFPEAKLLILCCEIGARTRKVGARFWLVLAAWNLHFECFLASISWWITLKITLKVSTNMVMTESHHNPKLASLLVLKEHTKNEK
jgi:hypothetical protein